MQLKHCSREIRLLLLLFVAVFCVFTAISFLSKPPAVPEDSPVIARVVSPIVLPEPPPVTPPAPIPLSFLPDWCKSEPFIGDKPASEPEDIPECCEPWCFTFRPLLSELSTSFGNGIGYCKGFYSFDLLMGPYACPCIFLPLLDFQFQHIYEKENVINVGIAGRYIFCDRCAILGINAYYDFRQGKLGDYHQIGVGMEWLSDRWEARINGYVPVGQQYHTESTITHRYAGGFFVAEVQTEYPLFGANLEVGYYLAKAKNFEMYIAGGPYYLQNQGKSTCGAELRIRNQYKEYFIMEVSVTHDGIFDTNYQAEVSLRLPLYRICRNKNTCLCIEEKMYYQPIQRFTIMPLNYQRKFITNF